MKRHFYTANPHNKLFLLTTRTASAAWITCLCDLSHTHIRQSPE